MIHLQISSENLVKKSPMHALHVSRKTRKRTENRDKRSKKQNNKGCLVTTVYGAKSAVRENFSCFDQVK